MKQAVRIRIIKCPLCREGHLLDASEHTDLHALALYPPDKADHAELFVKCPVCKRQIGLAIRK